MKLLLYCCKGKPYLYKDRGIEYSLSDKKLVDNAFTRFNSVNGKIVAECDFEVEKIKYQDIENYNYDEILPLDKILEKSCLTKIDLEDYLNGNNGYAIHIKNLHIFDEPEPLEYYEYGSKYVKIGTRYYKDGTKEIYPIFDSIKKAPQNMAEVIKYPVGKAGKFILISIHPEWLVKILNGEKTIEVRKKVLKEMLK